MQRRVVVWVVANQAGQYGGMYVRGVRVQESV